MDAFQTFFEGHASFENTSFKGYADFSEANFAGYTSFRKAKFLDYSTFLKTKFYGKTLFSGSRFEGESDFTETVFNKLVTFSEAQFISPATFFLASFKGNAFFCNAIFRDSTLFRKITFSGKANFSRTQFQSDTIFKTNRFAKEVDFSATAFQDIALFSEIEFIENAILTDITFKYGCILELVTAHSANLSGCHFEKPAYFNNCNLSSCQFGNCFVAYQCVFFQCDLGQTSLLGAHLENFRFIACAWPKCKERRVIYDTRLVDGLGYYPIENVDKPEAWKVQVPPSPEALADIFRRLKKTAAMEQDHALASDWHFAEKDMVRREHRSSLGESIKPHSVRSIIIHLSSWLSLEIYRACSGYGERPLRAFILLVTLVCLPLLPLPGSPFSQEPASFLPLVKISALKGVETWGYVWRGAWQLLITIQAGLFALAVRNRMRR